MQWLTKKIQAATAVNAKRVKTGRNSTGRRTKSSVPATNNKEKINPSRGAVQIQAERTRKKNASAPNVWCRTFNPPAMAGFSSLGFPLQRKTYVT